LGARDELHARVSVTRWTELEPIAVIAVEMRKNICTRYSMSVIWHDTHRCVRIERQENR
jgi:hypothetical protein